MVIECHTILYTHTPVNDKITALQSRFDRYVSLSSKSTRLGVLQVLQKAVTWLGAK
jgi:hypothetical protein